MEGSVDDLGWYVSDRHCRRAIGYLSVALVERGYLSADFQLPFLLEMWGEALEKTMLEEDPSPIGPNPELARKILEENPNMAEPKTEIERRLDRQEKAILKLAENIPWANLEQYRKYRKEIEEILNGTETTSETRSDTTE
jgi:hypothetical protein